MLARALNPELAEALARLMIEGLPISITCAVLFAGLHIALKARRSRPAHFTDEQQEAISNIKAEAANKPDLLTRAVPRTSKREPV